MSEHYYSRTPKVESNPSYWDFNLRENSFRFKVDKGVFSQKEVDFGSRLLIETFILSVENGPVLDVGCGYGPIGLAIAKSYPASMVHMVDVNTRALELARDNAEINGVKNVSIYESDRLTGVTEDSFVAIVTNPPIRAGKNVVQDIFEQSFEKLSSGGELWVVIQKKQGAPSAIDKLSELFSEVETVEKKKGYFIIKAKKS